MRQLVEAPDWSFVVISYFPSGRYCEAFTIDQALALPKGNAQKRSLRNSVESYLHAMGQKTGLGYYIIFEGHPRAAEQALLEQQTLPF